MTLKAQLTMNWVRQTASLWKPHHRPVRSAGLLSREVRSSSHFDDPISLARTPPGIDLPEAMHPRSTSYFSASADAG
jgi:hypothetical protein